MPSGLLQGKGCYDSVLPCEDNSNLFQSIRHHNTSFILEQRHALEKQENLKKDNKTDLEQELVDWLANGALPMARKCVKFLFLLTLFPFYFCLFLLPSLIVEKLVKPAMKVVNTYIIQPISNAFLRYIYRPVAFVHGKICQTIRKVVDLVKRPYLAIRFAVRSFVRNVKLKIYHYVIAPPLRLIKNVRRLILKGVKAFTYGTRASYLCGRLLARHGLEHIRSFKTNKKN